MGTPEWFAVVVLAAFSTASISLKLGALQAENKFLRAIVERLQKPDPGPPQHECPTCHGEGSVPVDAPSTGGAEKAEVNP